MNPRSAGTGVARWLIKIHRDQLSGVLDVLAEGTKTQLYFSEGRLVFAEQGTLGGTLGRMLVAEDRLTQAQYAKIIDRMTESLVDSEQMRFGEVAVALGFLEAAEVHEALRRQVRRKAIHCMQWEEVEGCYRDGSDALSGVAHFPTNTAALVVEGVHTYYDFERLERLLAPYMDRYVRLTAEIETLGSELGLHPAQIGAVRSLDGTKTMAAVVESMALDSLTARRLFTSLLLTRAIEVAREPWEVKGREPTGRTRRATGSVVARRPEDERQRRDPTGPQATHRPRRTTGRAAMLRPGPADGQGERNDPTGPLSTARARRTTGSAVVERPRPTDGESSTQQPDDERRSELPDREDAAKRAASELLRQMKKRGPRPTHRPRSSIPPADEKRARLEAEKAFQSGQRHMSYGAWPNASRDFRKASRYCPGMVEYDLYATWAEHRAKGDSSVSSEDFDRLDQLVLEALKKDREMAFAWFVAGQVALHADDDAKALKSFRIASRLDPKDVNSARYVRLLIKRRDR